ncbi:hypothetical protein KSX_71080 [Ktedonospora formicarum]|uniref:Uncharacterized protein n=1 Tax=Ktedonospora formicarum TaxID=2778364 RepID=A0A8J3I8U2_9CHLR|nr:hypothetical protein KSX_71080 [Ktedonospora formicarum]
MENIYLSVDPYMRSSMDAVWDLHTPLDGRAIGCVVESRIPHLVRGDLVLHRKGWRTHALVRAEDVQGLPQVPGVPISAYLGILGGTGLAAYVALTKIARLQTEESVFISAAAGGVGSAAGQIARLLGASRVIGSAGSAAKVTHLTKDLGFDAAFDYHDGPVSELLTQVAPKESTSISTTLVESISKRRSVLCMNTGALRCAVRWPSTTALSPQPLLATSLALC